MGHFVAKLPDGIYFVDIIEFKEETVVVETLDGRQFEIKREDLQMT